MDVMSMDAALASKKAQDSELVQLKSQVDRLRRDLTPGASKDKKLREACTNFEAVFISKLWEQMRATVPKGGYLNSPQEDMYRSMFDRDFSEKMAKDGGIGLGDMLYKQLKGRLANSTKTAKADGASSVQPGTAATAQATTQATGQATADGLDKSTLEARKLNPLKVRTQTEAPARPASVAGDVMPDVEALATRIENAYDRRAQSTAQSSGSSGASTGRRLAVIG